MLTSAPLAVAGVAIFLVLLVCVELGFRGRVWLSRGDLPGASIREGESFLLSAALGVLAILLGFTFSLALDRFETRRGLVTQEAAALNAVRLQIHLMPQEVRADTLGVLRAYVGRRLAWSEASAGFARDDVSPALQERLWRASAAITPQNSPDFLGPDMRGQLLQAFNIAEARAAARESRVPDRIIWILLLYSILATTLLGYVLEPTGKHHRVASTVVVALLAISLVLILDVDRPRTGAVLVSQAPMERLGSTLARDVALPRPTAP